MTADHGPARRWRRRARELLIEAIARSVPWIVRRSLRGDLHGVWVRGAERAREALRGGGVLAPNHHAWWDGYLLWYAARRLGLRGRVLVEPATLESFPFFEPLGAVPSDRLRTCLRALAAGETVAVFPEGEQRTPGQLGELGRGAAFLARGAERPLVPLAIHVTLRGAQHPEAYLSFGAPLEPSDDDARTTARLAATLGSDLAELRRAVDAAELHAPPPGFERWLGGAESTDRRAASLEALWRR